MEYVKSSRFTHFVECILNARAVGNFQENRRTGEAIFLKFINSGHEEFVDAFHPC